MNKRLFIAIDPPLEIREQLASLCYGLPEARWTPIEQFHLTLNFIGEVDGTTFLDIRESLTELVLPSFELRFKGVGFFPPRGTPRVVWAGVEPSEPLMQLQRKITTHLRQLGVELEKRKYFPHITLARLRQTPANKVGKYLTLNNLFTSSSFASDRFTLYSSILGRKGAIHIQEQEYLLAI
nr:RNA 2',3'-cyclic phosphodiesterase [uncultured Desulfobulbus sp.]